MSTTSDQNIFTIYHAGCSDGTAAAAVVLKKFPQAKQYPLAHSHSEDELQGILNEAKEGDTAYIVDCYIGVEALLAHGLIVTVIDHHADAKERLEQLAEENENLTFIFDNDKSGASLTWSYLFPEKVMPEVIKYIEDVDLWRWQYGDASKQINSIVEMHTNQPEELLLLFEKDIALLQNEGAIIATYVDYLVEHFVRGQNPTDLQIDNHHVLAYNVAMTGAHTSMIGSTLSELHGQAVVLFKIKGNEVSLSFRSRDGQSPTANELAQTLGGGGHTNASGATVSLDTFISLIQRNDV